MRRKHKTRGASIARIALFSLPFMTLPMRLAGGFGGSNDPNQYESIITEMKTEGKAVDLIHRIEGLDALRAQSAVTDDTRAAARQLGREIDNRLDLTDWERGALRQANLLDIER